MKFPERPSIITAMEPHDLKLKEGTVLLGDPLWTVNGMRFYTATCLTEHDMTEGIVAFADEEIWDRVLRELAILREIPGFPEIFAVSDEERAVACRLPEGAPLTEVVGEYRHPARALPLLLDLLKTLQALHTHGYVLQGIRPEQVWVTAEGRGLLLRLPPWPRAGERELVDYAEGYVAPEVLFGGEIGPSSDVYVVGALLYRLVFGKDPADFFAPQVRSPLREIYRAPWPGVVQILIQSLALQRDRLPDCEALYDYVERVYRLEYAPRLHLEVGAFSSIGRNPSRLHNEDAFSYTVRYAQTHEEGLTMEGLFLVADGMGGAARGEEAARLAMEVLHRELALASLEMPVVREALQKANHVVFSRARELYGDAWEAYMGTTVAGLWVRWPRAIAFNVGDTRIYRIAGERVEQLSVDHSALAQAGGAVDPRGHPSRHELVYAVGPWKEIPEAGIHVVETKISRGDVVVLLTDGVWESITDEEMIRFALESVHPQDLSRRLVRVAVERGGKDNATAMVIRVSGGGD